MTIDDVLHQIQARLGLEAETEYELLEELRGHLEEAVDAARAGGCDEQQALREAAAAFDIEQTTVELHATHAGWGALEGVSAAALPVLFALILRWLIFAPNGTAEAWRGQHSWPDLLMIAVLAIAVPLVYFPRRRYALALWIFFWGLSLITVLWPTTRW